MKSDHDSAHRLMRRDKGVYEVIADGRSYQVTRRDDGRWLLLCDGQVIAVERRLIDVRRWLASRHSHARPRRGPRRTPSARLAPVTLI